jgi:hypothetical protein
MASTRPRTSSVSETQASGIRALPHHSVSLSTSFSTDIRRRNEYRELHRAFRKRRFRFGPAAELLRSIYMTPMLKSKPSRYVKAHNHLWKI